MTDVTMTMTIPVTVTLEIKAERISDLLCCALEGGSTYWAGMKSVVWPEGATYASEAPMLGGSFTLEDASGEDWPEARPTVDREACLRGLKIMAEKHPRHFSRFMENNEDAETGDVFLQLCVFGEIVFG